MVQAQKSPCIDREPLGPVDTMLVSMFIDKELLGPVDTILVIVCIRFCMLTVEISSAL